MGRSFGVVQTVTGLSASLLQSVETGSTVDIAEARDADGKVTDEIAYSQTKTATVDFVVDGTDTVAEAGASEVIGGLTGLITDATETENNTAYKTGRLTVKIKDGATQVAYS